MQSEFMKGDSRNLPTVDIFMILDFFMNDDELNAAELRGAKANRSMRDEYVNNAVGYVCVKRTSTECVVRADVCPEHNINQKNYKVDITISENFGVVRSAKCQDCSASEGTCKHAVALLMWLNKKSQEPSPTQVTSYWKKPRLSGVNKSEILKLCAFGATTVKIDNPDEVRSKFLSGCGGEDHVMLAELFQPSKNLTLSVHMLICTFLKNETNHEFDNFNEFIKTYATSDRCQQNCDLTVKQRNSPLWFELRYGRITASNIYAASRARDNNTLISTILGLVKVPFTTAIQRGQLLEKDVLKELSRLTKTKYEDTGFLISSEYPLIGASPDGISTKYVVEIKCPMTEKTFDTYFLPNSDEIGKKFEAQLQLQMFIFKKKKGIFCVASPNFEKDRKITFKIVKRRTKYIKNIGN